MPKDTRVRVEIITYVEDFSRDQSIIIGSRNATAPLSHYANELRLATLGWCKGVITGKEFDERYAQLRMIYGRS